MRWLVSVALAVGLVSGLLFASGFAFTQAVLVAGTHGLEARPGFALGDPAPEPKQFEQPIPVQVEEPFCAPSITLEPDGSATACGLPIADPPPLDATSI